MAKFNEGDRVRLAYPADGMERYLGLEGFYSGNDAPEGAGWIYLRDSEAAAVLNEELELIDDTYHVHVSS